MYNTNITCIYYDNTDDYLNSELFFDKSHELYQKDLLKCFQLDKYDDESINKKITYLYNLIKDDDEWKDLLKNALNKMNLMIVDDLEYGFILLFSYDYFYLTHECLKHFLKHHNNNNKFFKILKKKYNM